jgi:tellurite resistance protein TehA-like permease
MEKATWFWFFYALAALGCLGNSWPGLSAKAPWLSGVSTVLLLILLALLGLEAFGDAVK